jgi:hypothetical protein
MQYKTFWNEDHKKIGYPLGPQMVNAVLAPITLYACLTDAPFADTMIKLAALWSVANGVLMTIATEASCEAYGVEASDTNKASMKTLGFMCAGSAVFQVLNTFTDMDPVQAFGECILVAFSVHRMPFLSLTTHASPHALQVMHGSLH